MKNSNYTVDKKNIKSELSTIIKSIVSKFMPLKIVLFGSHANGIPDTSSDIDLMIITDSKISSLELGAEIAAHIPHTFPVDIVVKNNKELEKRIKMGDFFLQNIIKNGKVIYERHS